VLIQQYGTLVKMQMYNAVMYNEHVIIVEVLILDCRHLKLLLLVIDAPTLSLVPYLILKLKRNISRMGSVLVLGPKHNGNACPV
jgi:hypothetical protein